MGFLSRFQSEVIPEWAEHYVPLEELQQILRSAANDPERTASAAKEFIDRLSSAVAELTSFLTSMETQFRAGLQRIDFEQGQGDGAQTELERLYVKLYRLTKLFVPLNLTAVSKLVRVILRRIRPRPTD